jgi:adenylyl- and sulfurtransferase ThiI
VTRAVADRLATTIPALLIAFGDIQQQVVPRLCPAHARHRLPELMLRIAEKIARARRAQALVTGDVVGQWHLRQLENLAVIGRWRQMRFSGH